MKIKNICINRNVFEEEIEDKLKKKGVKKEQIINITEDERFFTLWYWNY
jgi:hypothetical protein